VKSANSKEINALSTDPSTQQRMPSARGSGLSISVWLVLGFAVVIGALVTGGITALRSTRHATADMARVQTEFQPLIRQARDLGAATAAFDRAVLTYLRADTRDNRATVTDSAALLSATANTYAQSSDSDADAGLGILLSRIGQHQADGFEMLAMQDRRRTAVRGLEHAYDELDRRVRGAGGRGLAVENGILMRPSLAALADALTAARNDATHALGTSAAPLERATLGESRFQASLADHAADLSRSPGAAWLELVQQDFARAVELRRRIGHLDAGLESRRSEFAASGGALTVRIRDDVEGPAWHRLRFATDEAKNAVADAERAIGDAILRAGFLALLGMLAIAWTVTRPVRRLTAGTRRLAAGDLATRVTRGGASELDELAQAFNHMAAELSAAQSALKSQQLQLEQRVEERTLQLRHLAEHDPLTNLPNRRQLFQRLDEMIVRADPGRDRLAVLFLDLDNFKTVNDSLGHDFGDRVLTEIGARLHTLSDEAGFIARLGGDEFTLLFHFQGSADEIRSRAESLVASFQRPLVVDRREIAIGVSCGAAIFPEHGRDAMSLLRAADAALFRAKELGRNQLCLYDHGLLAAASNRFRIEQALRKAIEGGDFVVHYQPQVCLVRQQATCMEALLRWRKSDTQIVPAGEFISIAEQSGLMLDLHEWVIEEAARAVAEWRRRGWKDARVAVNVSAQQFLSGDFLGDFERLLARHALPADAFEIELTENVLQTGTLTVEMLRSLRQLGVAIALDDFGTGFSSLTSLERLPLTRVKIDRSVVADLDRNPRAAAIARSIIGLCRSLGLQVTVEGVERPSQLDVLATFGEVSVQGYLVASPADGERVLDFVNGSQALLLDALLQAAGQRSPSRPDDETDGAIHYLRRRRP
jgi:diguanylate cyclase (GGDEF)-like protein